MFLGTKLMIVKINGDICCCDMKVRGICFFCWLLTKLYYSVEISYR
jgi:hypothetical protein